MIVTIAEHQHLKNDYVCSFCGDKEKLVVGRAYTQHFRDHPTKHYLFSYCKECGERTAEKMLMLLKWK